MIKNPCQDQLTVNFAWGTLTIRPRLQITSNGRIASVPLRPKNFSHLLPLPPAAPAFFFVLGGGVDLLRDIPPERPAPPPERPPAPPAAPLDPPIREPPIPPVPPLLPIPEPIPK